MKLLYNTSASPKEIGYRRLALYAVQLMLAVVTGTLVVPLTVGHGMSAAAALFGAGVATLIYILVTKGKSPVFFGSSHALIGAMTAAFAGGVSMSLGYFGLLIGALTEGGMSILLAIIVKFCGTKWIDRVMPSVVIGPTVALIGLELAEHTTHNLMHAGSHTESSASPFLALLCGLLAFAVSAALLVRARSKALRGGAFVWGILVAYALTLLLTMIGTLANIGSLQMVDLSYFSELLPEGRISLSTFFSTPDFAFLTAFKGSYDYGTHGSMLKYVVAILLAYVPISFVMFAEHIADHAHISEMIGHDLLEDPGLARTLMGDGLGSIFGGIFSGCPNTSYSEATGCMGVTGITSVWSMAFAAVGLLLLSFFSPFMALVASIPTCIIGGVCIAFYGFVAVAGLSMMKGKDLEAHRNLFPIAVILITGLGELSLSFGGISIPPMACALILGILTNLLVTYKPRKASKDLDKKENL